MSNLKSKVCLDNPKGTGTLVARRRVERSGARAGSAVTTNDFLANRMPAIVVP